jgi:hypothetical protein
MKKFLKNCTLFLIPFVVAAILAEIALRSTPNSYRYKYQWMQENADNVETLVFGSSHAIYGIRPEFFEGKTFNLANVSQGTKEDLWLLKHWSARYHRLRTIIVPISFFSLFSRGLEYGAESYRCRYYSIYMNCDLYPIWPQYHLELSDYRTAKGKLGTFFYNMLVKPVGNGCDVYGWSDGNKLEGKDMKRWNDGSEAKAAIQRHTAKNWNYVEKNSQKLKEMAEYCKKRNIRMVLITTPCWHTYYDNLDKRQLSKMYEIIRQFQEDYNIPYFDYLKDSRFVADDFYDSNHLSEFGAAKFSKILNDDINK